MDLIILANSSGVSLMDLFGDESHEVSLIITSNHFNLLLEIDLYWSIEIDLEEKIEVIRCNNQIHFMVLITK